MKVMRLSLTWSINSVFTGLSPDYGQIAHLLRTRAPVAAIGIATNALPLDLHVLGLSLAFILSQDQTLRCKIIYNSRPRLSMTNLSCNPWQGLFYPNSCTTSIDSISQRTFSFSLPPRFRSEIGCKSTATKTTDQIFNAFFWKKSVSRWFRDTLFFSKQSNCFVYINKNILAQ